jgi:DNA-directed RNA polymerase specialized sigma24 family protein
MRIAKHGAIKFRSRSAKAAFLLQKYPSWSQTAIAKRCGISIPCVNQVLARATGVGNLRA